jgi:hypothetical protein
MFRSSSKPFSRAEYHRLERLASTATAQPEQTVTRAEASIRTSEHARLMTEGPACNYKKSYIVQRDFEWDAKKAAQNVVKHGVPLDYAARVFSIRTGWTARTPATTTKRSVG